MTDISPVDRLFCAIDTSKLDDALLLADLLSGEIGTLKLGKEFFTAHGPEGVRKVAAFGHKIFLDLKYLSSLTQRVFTSRITVKRYLLFYIALSSY